MRTLAGLQLGWARLRMHAHMLAFARAREHARMHARTHACTSAGLSTVKRGGLEETTNSIGLNKFSQFTSEGLGVNKTARRVAARPTLGF
jgi:hypothetical protein